LLKTCKDTGNTKTCGWCPSFNRSFLGNHDGPYGNITCPTTEEGQWTYNTKDCECLTVTKCEDISQKENCGWCTENNKSLIGNANGPYYGAKCIGKWIWSTTDCPKIINTFMG